MLDERYGHLHWVHVLNNAALMASALARSGGDFGAAICAAVAGGWDTDSTGATVGSVCGALAGAAALPPRVDRPAARTGWPAASPAATASASTSWPTARLRRPAGE